MRFQDCKYVCSSERLEKGPEGIWSGAQSTRLADGYGGDSSSIPAVTRGVHMPQYHYGPVSSLFGDTHDCHTQNGLLQGGNSVTTVKAVRYSRAGQ